MAHIAGLCGVFEQDHVAGLRGTFDGSPGATLLTQCFDHRIDVDVGYLGDRLGNGELGDVDLADIGQDFERSGVFDLAVGGFTGRVDFRRHGGTQILLANGFLERRADQLGDRLAAHLRAKPLLDDLGWNLAGPKTLEAHAARDLGQPRLDLRFVVARRNTHGELALELAHILYGNLHDCSSKSDPPCDLSDRTT